LWTCPGPHDFHEGDGLQIARSRDHCLVYASVAEAGAGLRNLSRELYDAMLTGERLRDYPHIVKAWNYIAEINEGEADDERYKQFCLGRGEVYDALLPESGRAPSATAIGSAPGEPLTVMLLLARRDVSTFENPRQVSAFRYPRQYGPRSPNFSRAALLDAAGGHQLFISGTAAIVGHESRHHEDVSGQLAETVNNLESLFEEAGQRIGTSGVGFSPSCHLRVYVRHAKDAERVTAALAPLVPAPENLVLLEGAICRSELLVEMDGIIDELP
ncbi:MAG: hypothetical protein AAGE01_16065, partial [Pseudomonadota bacterium]